MVSETKRPYEIGGFVGGITPSHASYQVLTNTSSGMVQPVDSENLWEEGTKIARVLRCTKMKCMYVEL